jgi:hypothetical protein
MHVTDINNQLRQAKGQAAALGTFFHSTANTWSKRLIFLAIPVNTALYGAESWTLNVELRQQISSFYHTTICRIIGINMHHVAEYQIKNEHIHNYFSVPDPIDIIRKRQFNLLGKFDNFRMNTGYGRYGAAYNMVTLICFNDKLLCV